MSASFNQSSSDRLVSRDLSNYVVYRIVEQADTKTRYVGICHENDFTQCFSTHITRDLWAPWHWQQVPFGCYDRPKEFWPFYPQAVESLIQFTCFEATAAHQYWWEYFGGFSNKLLNTKQPLRRTEFILGRGKGCWEGYMKGFPNGWVPRL